MESKTLELVMQHQEKLKSVFLFVGEGNFSFSASLAKSPNFHDLQSSLIASDYIPELADELSNCEVQLPDWNEEINGRKFAENKNTSLLKENIAVLKSLEHHVFFDVNAARIHEHEEVLEAVKDFTKILIIFNFPHVKCKKMKIGLNRDLLRDFFVSCDKFTHCLRRRTCNKPVEVIPVVSLCAGQSGIPEVEVVTKPRCWGDSWQINDMAAHGNFVCVNVCKFEDWDIFSTGKSSEGDNLQGYQSSYFRLQSGVSFSTADALTFTYQQRHPIDTQETNRIQSMVLSAGTKFLETFHPILEEGMIPISQDFKDYNKSDDSDKRLPYIHFVKCTGDIQQVHQYLNFDLHSESLIVNPDNQICLNLPGKENFVVGIIEDDNLILYANYLVELKFKCQYRQVMELSFGDENALPSLYPRSHEFHISFWINESFTMQKFMEVILDVYGLMLKTLEFLEEFTNGDNRISICWRIQVEALEFALSREAAHQLYLNFRHELEHRLDLDVR